MKYFGTMSHFGTLPPFGAMPQLAAGSIFTGASVMLSEPEYCTKVEDSGEPAVCVGTMGPSQTVGAEEKGHGWPFSEHFSRRAQRAS